VRVGWDERARNRVDRVSLLSCSTTIKLYTNFAGGSPAAGYLSWFAKKGNPKKANPNPPPLRGSLRCWLRHNLKVSLHRNKPLCGVLSTGQAAAELARSAARPRAQTVLADYPWPVCATRWWMRGTQKQNSITASMISKYECGLAHTFLLWFWSALRAH